MIRWPLVLLALPAAVATWSGWVGLGKMVGFGVVTPLPGIADGFTIDTSITLPIGVEAYAGYALAAWLSGRRIAPGTRRFAKWSALGSLLLGALGQVAYHLLVVAGYTVAPWQVVTIVSCLPVAVLGMGAGLHHMLSRDARAVSAPVTEVVTDVASAVEVRQEVRQDAVPESPGTAELAPVEENVKDLLSPIEGETADLPPLVEGVPGAVPGAFGDVPEPAGLLAAAASKFFYDIARGDVPGIREIKAELGIGQSRAQDVRTYLSALAGQ